MAKARNQSRSSSLGLRQGQAQGMGRGGASMIGGLAGRPSRRRAPARRTLADSRRTCAEPERAFQPGSAIPKLIAETALYSLGVAASDGAICLAVCPVRHFRAQVGLI